MCRRKTFRWPSKVEYALPRERTRRAASGSARRIAEREWGEGRLSRDRHGRPHPAAPVQEVPEVGLLGADAVEALDALGELGGELAGELRGLEGLPLRQRLWEERSGERRGGES